MFEYIRNTKLMAMRLLLNWIIIILVGYAEGLNGKGDTF